MKKTLRAVQLLVMRLIELVEKSSDVAVITTQQVRFSYTYKYLLV